MMGNDDLLLENLIRSKVHKFELGKWGNADVVICPKEPIMNTTQDHRYRARF